MGRKPQAVAHTLTIPLIVDTSVWIDFFNNSKSVEVEILTDYIQNDKKIYLTPTIVQEILQGIKNDTDYKRVKEILLNFIILEINQIDAAIGSAELYRAIRKKGATIRKSNDCLIAFYAIYFKITLLENDKDFDQISTYSELKTVRAI